MSALKPCSATALPADLSFKGDTTVSLGDALFQGIEKFSIPPSPCMKTSAEQAKSKAPYSTLKLLVI